MKAAFTAILVVVLGYSALHVRDGVMVRTYQCLTSTLHRIAMHVMGWLLIGASSSNALAIGTWMHVGLFTRFGCTSCK
jgi:hypothetical protein